MESELGGSLTAVAAAMGFEGFWPAVAAPENGSTNNSSRPPRITN